jgi:transposase
MPMSKVDLYAAIRRDSRAGMSGRTIAQKYKVSRHTVQAALTSAWPQPRMPAPPRVSKLDEWNRAGAGLGQLLDRITRSVGIDVRDGDSCAGRGKGTRDRASDAVASTSDHQGTHVVQW